MEIDERHFAGRTFHGVKGEHRWESVNDGPKATVTQLIHSKDSKQWHVEVPSRGVNVTFSGRPAEFNAWNTATGRTLPPIPDEES